ncbi:MAG: acyltransferase [Oscillospiraceae bacterium]
MAPNCILTTATHNIGDADCRCGTDKTAPIIIEDGCWIGINVTILPGVTIGHGTIISAGSVVKKNCKPNSIYAGNPAKLVVAMTDKAPIM